MKDFRMGPVEAAFADMIWQDEPLTSTALAARAGAELDWQKSTSFTVLRRLCDKGLFRNDGGTVTSLISREEYYSLCSRRFVYDTFDGSLPAFLAAFTSGRKLTEDEARTLRRLVDEYGEKK